MAAGAPIPPDPTPPSAQPGPLWYAYRSTPWLWWHRLREHLTPRSVYFQGALRLALALAVARLLAGVFDLSHGFWVLLTVLTLLRTSAADTRSTLRPALVGTTAGALVAAALLVVGLPADGVRDRPARGDAGGLRGGSAARPRVGAGAVHAGHRVRLRAGLAGGLAAGGSAGRRRRHRGRGRGADRAPRVAARRLGRAAPGHRHVPRRPPRVWCGRRWGCSPRTPCSAARSPAPARWACSPTRPTRSTRPSGTRPRASTGRPRWWRATTPCVAPRRCCAGARRGACWRASGR